MRVGGEGWDREAGTNREGQGALPPRGGRHLPWTRSWAPCQTHPPATSCGRIADEGALYCGDLSYDVVKSTMSHHFRVLRESGLMHTEREGKHRRITRRDDVIEQRFPGLLAAVGLPPGKGQWPD